MIKISSWLKGCIIGILFGVLMLVFSMTMLIDILSDICLFFSGVPFEISSKIFLLLGNKPDEMFSIIFPITLIVYFALIGAFWGWLSQKGRKKNVIIAIIFVWLFLLHAITAINAGHSFNNFINNFIRILLESFKK